MNEKGIEFRLFRKDLNVMNKQMIFTAESFIGFTATCTLVDMFGSMCPNYADLHALSLENYDELGHKYGRCKRKRC